MTTGYLNIETKATWNGKVYSAELGFIEKTVFGEEDHGIWTVWIHFKFPGSGQGAGGLVMQDKDPENEDERVGTAFGTTWIMEVCRVLGVSNWESVKGRSAYALREKDRWGPILGIASATDRSKVFVFNDLFKKFYPDKS